MPDISISSESSAINHCNTIHVQKVSHLCSLCILHHTCSSNKTTARHTLLLHLHSVILLHSAFPNTTQSTKMTTTATIGYMQKKHSVNPETGHNLDAFAPLVSFWCCPRWWCPSPSSQLGKQSANFWDMDARWITKKATQTQNLPSCVFSFPCWKIHTLTVPNASGFYLSDFLEAPHGIIPMASNWSPRLPGLKGFDVGLLTIWVFP